MEPTKQRKRRPKDHRAYMRKHKRALRKLGLHARIAAKLLNLIPRVNAVIDGEPERELNEHAKFASDVREKLHAAGELLRGALMLADPHSADELLRDTALPGTELRRAVLLIIEQAGRPLTVPEIIASAELSRWSVSAVRRTLVELRRADLLEHGRRELEGQSTVSVWWAPLS